MKINVFLTLAFLALTMAACSSAPAAVESQDTQVPIVVADKVIVAEGNIEPVHFAEIAFNASGVVSEVFVEVGQNVKKGDVLVQLGNSETAQAEVARAEEALILAQREFDTSQSAVLKDLGDAYEAVRLAQIQLDNFDIPSDFAGGTPADAVANMYAKVEEARVAYEPYKNLGENNQSRKEYKRRLDDAWSDLNKAIRWANLEANLDSAKSKLESAQKEFAALSDDSRETSLAKAQYESALANLSAAKAALANVELVAPFDGVVANLDVKVGGSINAGQIAVTVADFSSWIMKTTDLTELDVVNIKQDQSVTITIDALPSATFDGIVQSIGQTYTEVQGDIVYEVTVTLTDSHPDMRWGMTAIATFAE